MLRRRLLTVVLPFFLMVGAIGLNNFHGPNVPVARAAFSNEADPDGNPYTGTLAGRPINGYSYNDAVNAPHSIYDDVSHTYPWGWGSAHGIAYALVNNFVVLLYPYHGRNACDLDGTYVYGPTDSIIGYFADQCTSPTGVPKICYGTMPDGSADCLQGGPSGYSGHDLAYIVLYYGNWPSTLNRVLGGYNGGIPSYWTITDDTGSGATCQTYHDSTVSLYQNFQYDNGDHDSYRVGANSSGNGTNWTNYSSSTAKRTCYVGTTLAWHNNPSYMSGNYVGATCVLNGGPVGPDGNSCPYRDSGTPFVASTDVHTVSGFGTSSWVVNGVQYIGISSLYEGFYVLYHYWLNADGFSSHLCKTASCT